MNREDIKRILYCMPETFGDIFVSTGVIDGLKKKFPNANIYFATHPQFFSMLDGNPNIKKVVEFHESMLNYRAYESFANQKGIFDMVFCPFVITQRIPHWIHSGFGEWLGKCYADMCNVEYGEQFIKVDNSISDTLPEKYITVHSQTRQDPKDYDKMESAIKRIKNYKIIQIGGPRDKKLNIDGIIDLRGKTTWQQTAGVLKKSSMHFGLDSCIMHLCGYLKTNSVILFGGTYAQQGVAPHYLPHIRAIETQDRGPCITSCHLIECEAKKAGYDKCINNIDEDLVVEHIAEIIGQENVQPPEPITLSAYMIIKDGVKYGFPFEESIRAAAEICDEVVVVDGGSSDSTLDTLKDLKVEFTTGTHKEENKTISDSIIKIFEHPWDMNNPTLFGDEKTYAQQKCTGNWLIQLDADEIIHEPYHGSIKDVIKKNKEADVIDFPVINFYGNDETIRIEPNCWKWRIYKNTGRIVHGIHGKARIFDADAGCITMDKKISDACEPIYVDTLEIAQHKATFDLNLVRAHELFKIGQLSKEEYIECLKKVISEHPTIFHYSWYDINRKIKNGEFWSQTWHGKKEATHNTTEDIEKRVKEKDKEILIKVDFDHPLKNS